MAVCGGRLWSIFWIAFHIAGTVSYGMRILTIWSASESGNFISCHGTVPRMLIWSVASRSFCNIEVEVCSSDCLWVPGIHNNRHLLWRVCPGEEQVFHKPCCSRVEIIQNQCFILAERLLQLLSQERKPLLVVFLCSGLHQAFHHLQQQEGLELWSSWSVILQSTADLLIVKFSLNSFHQI